MPLSRFKLCQQIAKFNTPFDHYGTVDLSANDDLEVKSRQTEQTFYPVPHSVYNKPPVRSAILEYTDINI